MRTNPPQENMRKVRRAVISSPLGVTTDGRNGILVCCVRCETWKHLVDFGMRYMAPTDTLRNQSHCAECRAEEARAAR